MSAEVPQLAALSLAEANQFFAQHPACCYDRPLPAAQYQLNRNMAQEIWSDDTLENARDLLSMRIQVGAQWQEVPR